MQLERYSGNPIVTAGQPAWRRVASFNPGVIVDNGIFYMFERACASLDPLQCSVGLLTSRDGFSFELAQQEPVLGPLDFDAPQGTVEDPRVVKIESTFYMTFVLRKVVSSCFPNGIGVPRYTNLPGMGLDEGNPYRTGLASSSDLRNWKILGFMPTDSHHDRDNVLFPGKVNGRYAMLRRPEDYVGPKYGCDRPSIWMSYSDDLKAWSEPQRIASPEQEWESKKIGAGPPPLLTEKGWVIVYHGVDGNSIYRVGLMLLDRDDPTRVIGRTKDFIMEPREYYERFGLIIPNVVFPSAAVSANGTLFVYYGCTDTCTSVATAPLDSVLAAFR